MNDIKISSLEKSKSEELARLTYELDRRPLSLSVVLYHTWHGRMLENKIRYEKGGRVDAKDVEMIAALKSAWSILQEAGL